MASAQVSITAVGTVDIDGVPHDATIHIDPQSGAGDLDGPYDLTASGRLVINGTQDNDVVLSFTSVPVDPPPPPPPDLGDIIVEPAGASVASGVSVPDLAAGMLPGEWAFVAFPATSPILPDDHAELATWWNTDEPASTLGPRTGSLRYVVNGENRQVFDGERWTFYGGGHADSNLNTVIQLSLDPLQWSRVYGPAYVPPGTAEEPCARPAAGPDHPGHTWGGVTWNAALGRMDQYNFMSYQSAAGCPQFPDEAKQVWSFTVEGGWVLRGENWSPDGKESRNIAALPDGRLLTETKRKVYHVAPDGTYTQLRSSSGSVIRNMRYDPNLGAVLVLSPGSLALWSTSGDVLESHPEPGLPEGYKLRHSGFDIDPATGLVWLIRNTSQMWTLDLDTGTWARQADYDAPRPDPGAKEFIWEKFRYIPAMGVFALVAPDEGVYLFRPPA